MILPVLGDLESQKGTQRPLQHFSGCLEVAGLPSISTIREVRLWLGVGQKRMGELLTLFGGAARSNSMLRKQTISMWENNRSGSRWNMGKSVRLAYGLVVKTVVSELTNGELEARVRVTPRTVRVTLRRRCAECGRVFTVKHRGTKRCARCRG